MSLISISILFVFLLHSFLSFSQKKITKENDKKVNCEQTGCLGSWSLFSSIDLTYTGYSSILGVEYERKKTSFYLAPKISLTQTYIPGRGPWGLNSGFKYLFLTNHERWRFFFNIDYQLALYNAFRQAEEKGKKKNYIHEINAGYGVRFKINERLYIGQSIGVGKYFENYYSYKTESRKTFSGYDALLRLYIKYRFSR
jgi:hypothetical protein